MPTVRYTGEGGRYRTGGVTFEPGDEHDVSSGKAEYLVKEVGDFEHVDGEGGDPTDEDAGEIVETAAADTDGPADGDVHEEDGPPDHDDGDDTETDSDGGFDIDEWLDQDYQDRADRVEAGEVDAHLDEIADEETSDTVTDAIGIRRAELEEK